MQRLCEVFEGLETRHIIQLSIYRPTKESRGSMYEAVMEIRGSPFQDENHDTSLLELVHAIQEEQMLSSKEDLACQRRRLAAVSEVG